MYDELTLASLSADLATGSTSSSEVVSRCLTKIEDREGEGARIFRAADPDAASAAAAASDALRAAGQAPSPHAGIPISIKDLFDIEAEVTCAGSKVLSEQPAAATDAPVVSRLRDAGFVIVGRTNMTEFAYSGLGLNPHYGTPLNPFDRGTGRIPGGSSSGAAVSITDGMAAAALGTDTGGSCRIPAALCGIVGFKPTQRRVPLSGVTPLSATLDSVGPLASTVACCAAIDAIIADDDSELAAVRPEALTIGVLQNLVFDDIEDRVMADFDRAVNRLSAAGIKVVDVDIPSIAELPAINAMGGFAAYEAYAWHKPLLESRADDYDPRVSVRILKGAEQSSRDFELLKRHRQRLIANADKATQRIDALIYPTVPFVAPPLDALSDDAEYARLNILALRNPSVTNFLDRCAITLPIHQTGSAPVGLNLMGRTMQDRELLTIAVAIEGLLRPTTNPRSS